MSSFPHVDSQWPSSLDRVMIEGGRRVSNTPNDPNKTWTAPSTDMFASARPAAPPEASAKITTPIPRVAGPAVSYASAEQQDASSRTANPASGPANTGARMSLWELLGVVAESRFTGAGYVAARKPGCRRMFLRAGDKARTTRDGHELAAEITAIGEQVIGR